MATKNRATRAKVKTKRKIRDPFPKVVYGQMDVEYADGVRTPYLTTTEIEEAVFDCGGDGSDFKPGERVAVYELVAVVKMTRRVAITRKQTT